MSDYGRLHACPLCGHAPEMWTERHDSHFSAWIACRCGVTTKKYTDRELRVATSNAFQHWNTRHGEQHVSRTTNALRNAAAVFVDNWRNGEYDLPRNATIDVLQIEKALKGALRSMTGD
jgi:glycerol kinase